MHRNGKLQVKNASRKQPVVVTGGISVAASARNIRAASSPELCNAPKSNLFLLLFATSCTGLGAGNGTSRAHLSVASLQSDGLKPKLPTQLSFNLGIQRWLLEHGPHKACVPCLPYHSERLCHRAAFTAVPLGKHGPSTPPGSGHTSTCTHLRAFTDETEKTAASECPWRISP